MFRVQRELGVRHEEEKKKEIWVYPQRITNITTKATSKQVKVKNSVFSV